MKYEIEPQDMKEKGYVLIPASCLKEAEQETVYEDIDERSF